MILPQFPPLLSGFPIDGARAPMDVAIEKAKQGCDAGLIVYHLGANTLRAAIILAPEIPLKKALAMFPACGVGFQNALGALAPPEVAVHLQWDGGILINGGVCGNLRVAASDPTADVIPDWLVVSLTVSLWPENDDVSSPFEKTALYAEGCGEVDAISLLESWAKHTLVWINRWSEDGTAPLFAEWRGLVQGLDETIDFSGKHGTFLGVDEDFGMLLKTENNTEVIPLTTLLET